MSALAGDRAAMRINELEQIIRELEGEIRALSHDCLLAYRERERARTLACRLLSEYEHVVGAWGGPGPVGQTCAAKELAYVGITISGGPRKDAAA